MTKYTWWCHVTTATQQYSKGFFSQGDTPWYVRISLQAAAGDWKQLQWKMHGCYVRDARISTRSCCIIPCREWCSDQHCLHPTGSLRSAINYNCDPYQYITGLWKPLLACPILRISVISKSVCLYISYRPNTVHIFACIILNQMTSNSWVSCTFNCIHICVLWRKMLRSHIIKVVNLKDKITADKGKTLKHKIWL